MSWCSLIFFFRFVFQAPSEICFTHLPPPHLHPPPTATTFSHHCDSPLIVNSEIRMCNLDCLLCVTSLPQRPQLCTYWPIYLPHAIQCKESYVNSTCIRKFAGGRTACGETILCVLLSNQVLVHLQMTSLFLVGGSRDKKHRNAK